MNAFIRSGDISRDLDDLSIVLAADRRLGGGSGSQFVLSQTLDVLIDIVGEIHAELGMCELMIREVLTPDQQAAFDRSRASFLQALREAQA